MEEWKEYKLGELLEIPIRNGLTKPKAIRGQGVKMIGMKEIFAYDIIRDCDMELVPVTEKELASSLIFQEDLLFARQSLTLEGAGKCSIVASVSDNTVFESHLIRLRINKKIANPYFIYYYFSSRYGKEQIKGLVQQVAAAGIRGKELINLIISIPSLPTQQKIANILSSLDDKIEVNRRINDNLEQQAQALYKQWFVDFEFPNEEGNPYKSSGGKMIKSEMGEIPEKWHVGALKDIANVIMGQSPNGKSFNENGEGIVFYQGRTEFGSRYPSIRLYTTEPTRFAEPMSVLLSVRAPVGDINIATQRCCIGRGVASIDSKTGDNSYMYCCLKELRPQLDQYNGEGTVFGSINRKELEGLPLCIPNAKVIHEFNNLITGIEKQMFNLYQECSNLTTLRDTLLPRLMSGELSVDDVSTDLVC